MFHNPPMINLRGLFQPYFFQIKIYLAGLIGRVWQQGYLYSFKIFGPHRRMVAGTRKPGFKRGIRPRDHGKLTINKIF